MCKKRDMCKIVAGAEHRSGLGLCAAFDGPCAYVQAAAVGVASVSASALPSTGVVAVSPRKGLELETPFELVAEYWVGDELPLKYGYETDDSVLRTPTANPKLANVRLSVPVAKSGRGGRSGRLLRRARRRRLSDEEEAAHGNVTLYVMVVDQVGAKGEGETSVVVMEIVVEGEALANLTNELLDNAFAAADLSPSET